MGLNRSASNCPVICHLNCAARSRTDGPGWPHHSAIKDLFRQTIWCVMQTEGRNCFSESSAVRSKYNCGRQRGRRGVRGQAPPGRRPEPRPCAYCRKERGDQFAPLSYTTPASLEYSRVRTNSIACATAASSRTTIELKLEFLCLCLRINRCSKCALSCENKQDFLLAVCRTGQSNLKQYAESNGPARRGGD